jgi:NAD(P)-dependent dehydrogenase (short-subunit alcohol dehydrogenase family)
MNHVALVTGGSSGLGYCLAREFAKHGFNILIVSHNPTANDDAVGHIKNDFHVEATSLTIDLREDTSAEAVYGFCRENSIQVDALVNNASSGTYGPFAESFVDDNEAIVQLDVVTLLDLNYLFLHDMKERGKGYIMNVASTAAFQPGPNLSRLLRLQGFRREFHRRHRRREPWKRNPDFGLLPWPGRYPLPQERREWIARKSLRNSNPKAPRKSRLMLIGNSCMGKS